MVRRKNGKNSKNGNGNDEPNLEKEFEEEINKPYYKVDYLDDFKLPYDTLDVSVIIPTYNRAPYKPGTLRGDYNPLAWAIKSLLLQKPLIKEIVVVDDNSDDFTEQVVESFKKEAKEKEIKILYVRIRKRSGSYVARDLGVLKANSKYLFFVDDDSIMAPYSAFGAVFTFNWLKEKGVNIGVLNLPPYSRTSLPNKIVPKNKIGHIDFSKGEYTSNKNAFPEEYLSKEINGDKFIHQDFHILEPIPIKNSGGYILCEKDMYVKIGGFSETVLKRFGDREFGCKVMENGYSIYFQADPKFQCVHGSYGLKTDSEFTGDDWFRRIGGDVSLKKAMHECNKPGEKTGHRIDVNEFYYQAILSVFYMLYTRNKEGAKKWIEKVYNKFVINGELGLFDTTSKEIPSEEERKTMWIKSIKEGLKFVVEKEKKDLEKVKGTIKKIEEQSKKSKEISKILKEL